MWRRRGVLAAAAGLAACREAPAVGYDGGWVGARHERGHRLQAGSVTGGAVPRRAALLILGGGVAGLAALRGARRRGIDDVQLLELDDAVGGNSRGHALGGIACPQGAHYLPLPTPEAREVREWLFEIGLLRHEAGRTVADERHLCHSPQERLFVDGAWVEGLLPPAAPGSATMAQYQRFARVIEQQRGFALPAHRGRGDPRDLDGRTFAAWLDAGGLDDPQLRGYLDYCCRDDYGAGIDTVSAWAGVHYFASRHGFRAPGTEAGDPEPVFTWPEGNAWLVDRLATPHREHLQPGRTVLRVTENRHDVQVLAWNEAGQQAEAWTAQRVIVALPLMVAVRVVVSPPPALREAASRMRYAPWLVANLRIDQPLLDRTGAPPSWDNVVFGSRGLGYVDAMHQSLRPYAGPTVLTAYHALPESERPALLTQDWRHWADRVIEDLRVAHPDLPRRVRQVALTRWGHAMAIPVPGVHSHPALAALRAQRGRLHFAHGDLAGYSVFEEAFTAGCEASAAMG